MLPLPPTSTSADGSAAMSGSRARHQGDDNESEPATNLFISGFERSSPDDKIFEQLSLLPVSMLSGNTTSAEARQ